MFDSKASSLESFEPILSSPSPGGAAPVKHNPIQKAQKKREQHKLSDED
jgi:hypothetical protein